MRTCRKCGQSKPLRMFEMINVKRGWYRGECKACTNRRKRNEGTKARKEIASRVEYLKRYHEENRDHIVAKATAWNKANPERRRENALNYYYRLQDAAILAYGGYKCSWCGIDDPICLSIDHVNNDGAEQRKKHKLAGAAFYRWLRDHDYPPGYVVLCMNCNHGKMRNGGVLPPSLFGRCNDHP